MYELERVCVCGMEDRFFYFLFFIFFFLSSLTISTARFDPVLGVVCFHARLKLFFLNVHVILPLTHINYHCQFSGKEGTPSYNSPSPP